MFTRLLTLLVLMATAECQGAWEARPQRHSPQGFSLTGGHQRKVHTSHHTAAQSTPPPQQGNNGVQSAVPSNSVAKETAHQHASSNNAATQAQKTEAANNIKPTHSSIPSQHTKHDAGWAAVHKGEVPYHHQPSEGMSKNLKRLLPHNKNSVSIVDHIWKMFQINPLQQTRTQEATNPGNAPAKGFRVKHRQAFQQHNQVTNTGNNDQKQTSMFNSNHNKHSDHHSSHKNNHNSINHQNTNHLQTSSSFNNNNNHHQFNNHMHNQHYNHLNQNKNIHTNNHNTKNNNHNNNNIYNRQHNNNTAMTGNIRSNVINPIKKVINQVLSPYDKIQTGLESIKSEVSVQQGMLGQLQSSMDKMKEIFFSIQRDMKNVLNAINSIMKTQ